MTRSESAGSSASADLGGGLGLLGRDLGGLALERVVERDVEVVDVRGGARRHLALDLPGEDEFDQRLLERLHVEEAALGDRVRDLLRALLPDQVGDARVHHHHLDGRDPAVVDARQEPLADHAPKDAGEHGADLLLLRGRKELDHPADGLGGVDRVQGREDEVARLGRLQRGLRGLGVAELADQDRVRVLAEHAAERLAEALGVEADLTLVDDRAPVRVEDLDRVLDRDDVLVPRPVDVVDHRRERRRLSRAGGAGDEDQAPVLVREPGDAGRHAQLLEARDVARDDAERERDRAPLAVDVDAETRAARRPCRRCRGRRSRGTGASARARRG